MYTSIHQYIYNNKTGYKDQNLITETSGSATLRSIIFGDILYNFKVFIPPGAIAVNIFAHCGQDIGPQIAYVVRKDQEPTTEIDSSVVSNKGFKISEINIDRSGINSGGYVFYIKDSGLNIADGFWIYINEKKTGTQSISDTQISVTVDVLTYLSWYNNTYWGPDGDPINNTIDVNTQTQSENITLPSQEYKTVEITFAPTEDKIYDSQIIINTSIGDFIYIIKGIGAETNVLNNTGSGEIIGGSIPIAVTLVSEFYNYQDLDGNNLIYGYDFKISDDIHTPPWKPIILCLIEKSPYWVNPKNEIEWSSFTKGGTPKPTVSSSITLNGESETNTSIIYPNGSPFGGT